MQRNPPKGYQSQVAALIQFSINDKGEPTVAFGLSPANATEPLRCVDIVCIERGIEVLASSGNRRSRIVRQNELT
jgi:hypothetical protein